MRRAERIPTTVSTVVLALALALAGGLGLAACSDGDSAAVPSTLPPIAPDPGPDPSTARTTTTTGPPAAVPAGFPTVVPLPKGLRLTEAQSITGAESEVPGWVLTYETRRPVAEAAATYGDRLEAAGFKLLGAEEISGGKGIGKHTAGMFGTSAAWTVSVLGTDLDPSGTLLVSVSPHRTMKEVLATLAERRAP